MATGLVYDAYTCNFLFISGLFAVHACISSYPALLPVAGGRGWVLDCVYMGLKILKAVINLFQCIVMDVQFFV
jgi:hypothetical protein